MRFSSVVVADIGASHVACGRFARSAEGRLTLQQVAFERFDSDPAREVDWLARAALALRQMTGRERLGGAVILGLPGHLALTKVLKTPAVAKSKREKILQFEAAQNIPHPLAEVVWDHVVVSEAGGDLEIMLTAAKTSALNELCAAADAADLSVIQAVPAGFALRDAFRLNYPDATAGVLLADIGARSSLLVFVDGGHFHVRTLAFAGNAVTETLAEELKIEFAAAEALKIEVSSDRSNLSEDSPIRLAVMRAEQAFASRLWLEIKRTMANLQRQAAMAPPTTIHLTGGGSRSPRLAAALEEKSTWPVEPFEPFRRVELSPPAAAAGDGGMASRLTGLVGLAAGRLTTPQASVNLLPAPRAAALVRRHWQPRLLAAGVLLVLALGPPLRHYRMLTAARRARTKELEAVLAPERARERLDAGRLEAIAATKQQIDLLQRTLAAKSNWTGFFKDLQDRLVEVGDCWLDRMTLIPPAPGAGPVPAPCRLAVGGRLLDRVPAGATGRADSARRANRLLASLTDSPFIAVVGNERFDTRQPGVLRFEVTLALDSERMP
jgi:type IV pilus assembly protein PilM